jgi:RHS repeat-associated protein
MRYPDGEVVSYGYAPGGELEAISSDKAFITSSNTDYVSMIGYDGFGARKYLKYGNGTETDFSYNEDTRQAKRMELYTSDNNSTASQIKILDKAYEYNGLGMISSISNSASHLGTSVPYNDLGGSYAFNYTYDDHGRLTTVDNSSWTGSDGTWNYSLNMSYASDGRILSKDQGFIHLSGKVHNTKDYTLNYTYNTTGEVHQLMQITEDGNAIDFTYNARGGIKSVDNSKTNELTTYAWDRDMRLWGADNNGGVHHNVYDWTGTRLMKSSLTSATVYVNGDPTTTYSVMPYIVYAGSHYVFEMYENDVEVSKHYFAGGERIATQMEVVPRLTNLYSDGETPYPTNYFGSFDPGDGNGSTAFDPVPELPQQNNIVLNDLCRLAWEFNHSVECNTIKSQSLPDYAYNMGDRDACWASESPFVPAVSINLIDYCNCTTDPDQAQANGANCNLYPFIYWYHHDHKGSTEFVTDLAGMVYEYHLYSPFGESLVSQNAGNSGYSNPYKFSGAIEDPETGLTYNVARFYNAKWSIWMSPDPMSFARELVTPYNYVLNNPVNRIDPTGLLCKETGDPDGEPEPIVLDEIIVTAKKIKKPTALSKFWKNTKAFTSGFKSGLGDGMMGTWDFISKDMWKLSTWRDMADLASMLASYPNSPHSLFLHAHLYDLENDSNTLEMLEAIEGQIDQAIEDLSSGDPERIGRATGQITWMVVEAFAGSKGAGSVIKVSKSVKFAKRAKPSRGIKSIGAAGRGFDKVLQNGGQTIKRSTAKALGLTKEQVRQAVHGLKDDLGLRNDFHGKIMGNGDYRHPTTGAVLGNLYDYVP